MSIELRFRGRLRDPDLLETMEDRIVELSMEIDGHARVWRSASDKQPGRVVRGVVLDLAPGVEPVSFVISPEGELTPLGRLEDAEEGRMPPRPWVSVDTGFGDAAAHLLLVALLDALKQDFLAEFEVEDEADYWNSRDLAGYLETRRRLGGRAAGGALDATRLAEELRRITDLVRRALTRPPEHPPVRFTEEGDTEEDERRYGTEQEWDDWFKEHRRKQERLMRAFEERTLAGRDSEEAFEDAMRSEGIVELPEIDGEEEEGGEDGRELPDGEETDEEDTPNEFAVDDDAEEDGDDPADTEAGEEEATAGGAAEPDVIERHPLVVRMRDLTCKLLKLADKSGQAPGGTMDALIRAVLEMTGGMVQSLHFGRDDDDTPHGHRLVQLKRALRGAAFAIGSLPPARALNLLDEATTRHAERELTEIEAVLRVEMKVARERLG